MPLGLRLRHGLAAAAATLVLTPATALAQGAGDDQYSDPFGTEEPAATPTPTPPRRAPIPTAAPAQAAPTSAPPGPAATPSGPTLPYTGVDAWPLAAAGALLLGAGLTLRVRLRDHD
jgi:hypothetical protein